MAEEEQPPIHPSITMKLLSITPPTHPPSFINLFLQHLFTATYLTKNTLTHHDSKTTNEIESEEWNYVFFTSCIHSLMSNNPDYKCLKKYWNSGLHTISNLAVIQPIRQPKLFTQTVPKLQWCRTAPQMHLVLGKIEIFTRHFAVSAAPVLLNTSHGSLCTVPWEYAGWVLTVVLPVEEVKEQQGKSSTLLFHTCIIHVCILLFHTYTCILIN